MSLAGPVVQMYYVSTHPPTTFTEGDTYAWPDTSMVSGISFLRSQISAAHLTDGLSNTFLLGEKYVNPDHYEDGADYGDDWSMYTGEQDDIYRSAYCITTSTNPPTGCSGPTQDLAGNAVPSEIAFGSAHSGAANFAFCDGSIRAISYAVDLELFRRLCNRKDGLVIDASKF